MPEPVVDPVSHTDVAGWVLGSLDPQETTRFRTHLLSCAQCQRDSGELVDVLTILDEVEVEVPVGLSGRTVQSVLRAAGGRRGRRRLQGLLIAAALAVVATLAGFIIRPHGAAPSGVQFALTAPVNGAARGAASARDTGHGWSIQLSVQGLLPLKDRAFYECWYVDPTRDRPGHPFRISAGNFDVAPIGMTTVQMSSWADPHDFPVMEITRQPLNGDPGASADIVLLGGAKL